MKVKLMPELGDNRDVIANIAMKLLNDGQNHTRVKKVTFEHNGKKYKFNALKTVEFYAKKYPELSLEGV